MKKIFGLLLIALAAVLAGCERDFDQPLLQEPVYDGDANMTIAEFREMFAAVSDPTLITADYVIRGYIIGNDETGNIYKQLYIEDETGGLCISIDQNSMYTTHRVGQEVFINLHGLYATKYGGALQIGYLDPPNNRAPWEVFIDHEFFNGYPNADKVKPRTLDLSDLVANKYDTDEILHTLVRFDNVQFQNGGKNPFSSTERTTEEPLLDVAGKSIVVRTSNFSTFVSETLPVGMGSVVGILGNYNGTWQLAIRGLGDVFNFPDDQGGSGETPGGNDGRTAIFSETFGNGTHTTQETRPKIADFTGWDEKGVTYTDQANQVTIRSTSSMNAHAWFPAGNDAYLTIAGINTAGHEDLRLSFRMAAQVDSADSNTYNFSNLMEVIWNGSPLTFSGSTMTVTSSGNNTFYTFEVTSGLTAAATNTLQFFASASANTIGLRIDDVQITAAGE